MTMMEDGDILKKLQTAVIAAVAASNTPLLPIKVIGRTFVPPSTQKWLEIVWIPNNPTGDFWGDEKNYQGMIRLILHWQNDDAGAYPPLAVIASIAGYFGKDMFIPGVKISENPNLTGALENGTETLYPVGFRYQSFRP